MSSKPWYTSQDVIDAVKRKIALPTFQGTFSDQDILDFTNEELLLDQVPLVMQYHNEYFTTHIITPLEANRNRYPIPERAIGLKLRDLHFIDVNNNLYEMTSINPDDRSFWQQSGVQASGIKTYYLEGNDIIIVPPITATPPQGSLYFSFYCRPNLLVANDRAATILNFSKSVIISNTNLNVGDEFIITVNSVPYTFTVVSGTPGDYEFQIGGTDALTASNLATAINNSNLATTTLVSNTINISYSNRKNSFSTSNETSFNISDYLMLNCDSIPTNFTVGSYIDILQTKPGHKTLNFSLLLDTNAIAGNTFVLLDSSISEDLIVGDYICLEYESIIPQIPTDLHSGLAERTSARILAAQGDQQGLQISNDKINQIKEAENVLLENRTEGNGRKITSRHSILRYSKTGYYRSGG